MITSSSFCSERLSSKVYNAFRQELNRTVFFKPRNDDNSLSSCCRMFIVLSLSDVITFQPYLFHYIVIVMIYLFIVIIYFVITYIHYSFILFIIESPLLLRNSQMNSQTNCRMTKGLIFLISHIGNIRQTIP